MQSFGATDVDRQLLGSSVEADVHEEREQEEKHAALNTIHTSNSNLPLHMQQDAFTTLWSDSPVK